MESDCKVNCANCKYKKKRDEQYYTDIVEALARYTIKKLWIALILMIVLFIGSNLGWLYYEHQWEVVQRTEIEQDTEGGGNNYIVGGNFNGEAESDGNEEPDA